MDHDIRKFMDIVEDVSEGCAIDEGESLNEDGRIVQGVNTTCDVSTGEITKQAAKFGNRVDAGGVPPLVYERKKVRQKRPGKWFQALFTKKS